MVSIKWKITFGIIVLVLLIGGALFMRTNTNIFPLDSIKLPKVLKSSGENWANASMAKRLTINLTGVADINLDSYVNNLNISYDSDMQSDMDDVSFYLGVCGQTIGDGLGYERITYTASQWGLFHVNSSLDTGGKSVCMYYGNSTVGTASNGKLTWDDNYILVLHEEESSGTIVDAVGEQNGTGTFNGAGGGQGVDGIWGDAIDFQGSSGSEDYVDLTTNSLYNLQVDGYTIETWFNYDNIPSPFEVWMVGRDVAGNRDWAFGLRQSGSTQQLQFQPNGQACIRADGDDISENAWHYGAVVYNGTPATVYFESYLDGESDSGQNTGSSCDPPFDATEEVYLGKRGYIGAQGWFDGTLDEVRISNITRDYTYFNQTYQQIMNPSTYINFGEEETQSIGDTTLPQFNNETKNKTNIENGDNVRFLTNITEDMALSYCWFSTNDTGSWVNTTALSISGNSNTCSSNITISSTLGQTIGWKFFANDSSNNLNSTDTFMVKITDLATISGRWVMRSPVNDSSKANGEYDSLPCRFTDGGVSPSTPAGCGNSQDIGVMWRNYTPDDQGNFLDIEEEERHCGAWGQFYFDDENGSVTQGTIENMYCHAWMYTVSPNGATIGVAINGSYDVSSFYDSHAYSTEPSYLLNSTQYYLVTYYNSSLNYDFDSNETFWNVSFKGSGIDVQFLSYPNQKSWCLVNLPDNSTLAGQDTDGDTISDYDELFITYTDPYDADTDDDGHNDLQEYNNNKLGYDPYDWGTIYKYIANDSSTDKNFYVENLSNFNSAPPIDSYIDGLAGEITPEDYDNLTQYEDLAMIKKQYDDDTFSFEWSKTQINYGFNVTQDVDSLIYVVIFQGSEFSASGSFEPGGEEKVIQVRNNTGSNNNISLPGRKGTTRSLFLKQFKDINFSNVIDENGLFYMRQYMRLHGVDFSQHSGTLEADYAELWVVTGESYVDITYPTTLMPLIVQNSTEITINFSVYEEGVEIISDISVNNITINGDFCTLSGSPTYTSPSWQQDCIVPNITDGTYDLEISANTSTSGILNEIETNAITYQSDSCSYPGSGDWTIQCSDICSLTTNTDISGNALVINGTGQVYLNANISGINRLYGTNNGKVCALIKSGNNWLFK